MTQPSSRSQPQPPPQPQPQHEPSADVPPAPPFFPPVPEPDHSPIRFLMGLMTIAAVALSGLGVAGIVTVAIAAPMQASSVNSVLLSLLAPSISCLFVLLGRLLFVVYKQVNSRMTQWMKQMEVTAAQQFTAGRVQGKAEALDKVLSASSTDLMAVMPEQHP